MRLQGIPCNQERQVKMNYDLLFVFLFYGFIIYYFFKTRPKWTVQGKIFAMYRTSLGLKLMDKISKKFPTLLKILGKLSVIIGFLGMGFIFYFLIMGTYNLVFVPKSIPALAPVLPGIKIPGLPTMSFWHWIISIFIVAVIHEFSHGVYSKLYKVPVKSSGFAFIGPILAAFVEPDEKILVKKSNLHQIEIFSAGPFSNILLGLVFFFIIGFVTTPIQSNLFESTGIIVNTVMENQPAFNAGLKTPFTITEINGKATNDIKSFLEATSNIKPGHKISLVTLDAPYNIIAGENPDNKSKGFIGISNFDLDTKVKPEIESKYGSFLPAAFSWINMLFFWIFVVSIGIGLFNLLPLGPVDGGRMFYSGLLVLFRNNEVRAKKIWSFFTMLCLFLIFINLVPYLYKLLIFIFNLFV